MILRTILAAIAAACLFNTASAETTSATATRPNVILLFADDMRADTIHALGDPDIRTPNLDRLASQGVAFRQAHIMGGQGGAVCVASRAMLMTGMHLHNLRKNGSTIPTTATMMGETFQRAGYHTYGIGKWHNNVEAYMRSFQDGDEILLGGMTQSQWKIPLNHYHKDGNYTGNVMPDTPNMNDLPVISDHVNPGRHSSEIFADAAVKFLGGEKAKDPFFLYVAFTAPHDPRDAPKDIVDSYPLDKIKLPPNFLPEHPFDNGHYGRDEKLLPTPRDPEAVKKEIRDYYAIITHLDSQVGRILDAVTTAGLDKNTIVIFAADNGLAVGQHGLLGKQSVYEHSVSVPMIWRGPGLPAGEKTDARVYVTEVFPTLCELLGLEKPASSDTDSFAASLKQPEKPFHDDLFFAFRDLHRGVNDGHYKLIEYNVNGVRHTQLFSLEKDRWETKNLADDPALAEVKTGLQNKLKAYHQKHHDPSNLWKNYKTE